MKFDWCKPRYWYHISKEDLGENVLFTPVETVSTGISWNQLEQEFVWLQV